MHNLRILCATDFSESADAAVMAAAAIARERDAKLTLVHVYDLPLAASDELSAAALPEIDEQLRNQAEDRLRACRAKAEELGARDVSIMPIRGAAAWDEIVACAERSRADLIVVGVRGRSGIARVLVGSVSERIARHAPCSVLVVR